jgi:hypothetical protein
MDITFSTAAPVYHGDEPALVFGAIAGGERVQCTISAEALRDHFGAASSREDDLRRAFDNHRAAIEGAAEQLLTSVGRKPVMLRSGYFRFSENLPASLHTRRQMNTSGHDAPSPPKPALPEQTASADHPRAASDTHGAG